MFVLRRWRCVVDYLGLVFKEMVRYSLVEIFLELLDQLGVEVVPSVEVHGYGQDGCACLRGIRLNGVDTRRDVAQRLGDTSHFTVCHFQGRDTKSEGYYEL